MRKTFHYIYKTTCITTGKFYIGKHTTHSLDNDYLGSGTILKNSIEKYGTEFHIKEILLFSSSLVELNLLEEKEVQKYLGNDQCMNIKPGGSGGWYNTSKIASERGTLFTKGMFGKKHSDESKLKMSLSHLGNKNNQYSKRAYINPINNERKILHNRPNGWLTPLEFNELLKKKNHSSYGKKWYNDGIKNFLLNTNDIKVNNLVPGRISPWFKQRKPN